ncbi:CLAVATA3/ESR (CLE)-related protein 25-like [Zingiber officinale]|uniref:CLAVATA3/ESR (CLE)-related protein 25-like n=1 Tax=Zingiber officinale TaxID=94328 RepID=UPI001C4AEE7C|nr:CLAVATA3/ESR (CLE)-related protein 25-like [Zingiber officinale]
MRRDSCTALAFLLCIALVVSIEAQRAGARARVAPQVAAPAVASSISRSGHQNLDPFYSSKRRVPNGPDPIHNRRAGKSGRPSGRI